MWFVIVHKLINVEETNKALYEQSMKREEKFISA